MLINIDNGGTLTDICVIDGARVHRTKTLTTPHDLSQCLMDGLRKASRTVYGEEDLGRLLHHTDTIRYSTTQGTNALVERKGPRLGLIRNAALPSLDDAGGLFGDLVGARVATLDPASETFASDAVRAVNELTAAGANRIVVAFDGEGFAAAEQRAKQALLHAFPSHLLGAVPVLYASELGDDPDAARRAFTALINAFLHPAMERFLYAAERQLRAQHARSPLLIFRNDGHSARVAKTTAIRTYSSGPRGGMEGARALAAQHGFARLLSMDVGGTTTDIGLVERDAIRADRHGRIEGVPVSFPLCDIVSAGVGGSSIIRAVDGGIAVGPESVGSAPGPACFGLGGREATITDAFFVLGLLDPASYFGGDLAIDLARARAAIDERVGAPLGLSTEDAAAAMERAWVEKIARSLHDFADIDTDLALAAFGGGGPLLATRIADVAGMRQVVVPALAPVFSAFGIGFSDIAHGYEAGLDAAALASSLAQRETELLARARRDLFAEGFPLEDCEIERTLLREHDDAVDEWPLHGDGLPANLPDGGRFRLRLLARKPIPHPPLADEARLAEVAATSSGTRRVFVDGAWRELPLWKSADQPPGASGEGPGVIEEAFSTLRVDAGWRFAFRAGGDLVLTRIEASTSTASQEPAA